MRISDGSSDVCSSDLEFRDGWRKSGGIGAWMIAGGLYGSKGVVAAARREVRRRLAGPRRKLHFFDRGRLDMLDRLSRPLSGMRRVAALRSKLASLRAVRSEEHTSELQSLMRISYAVFCLKKKNTKYKDIRTSNK